MKQIGFLRRWGLVGLATLCWSSFAHAALFHLTYDTTPNRSIDSTSVIVGTGTFSYDGPISVGTYLMSDLTGVSFSATFGAITFSGPPFDPADLALIGISVTEAAPGVFDLKFLGSSAGTLGSLDIPNGSSLLSHQPAALGSSPSALQLYFANVPGAVQHFGDYMARSSTPVSAPGTLALVGVALAAAGAMRGRKR